MKFVLCVSAVFVLIATNPSLEQHRERVRADVAEHLERKATGLSGAFARFIGVPDFAASTVAMGVSRANLIVCSFGMYDGQIVSFGALGCVVVR